MKRKARKSGGRASRVAARTAPVAEINPCPPGQFGGQYRPLNPRELRDILDTAFRLLAEIGMSEVPASFETIALSKGAELNNLGRLTFSRLLMEEIIDGAAKSFVFYGRDPKHDFEIGGKQVRFGTGGAAVQTLDLETGLYRASTLKDLYDFTRLIDTLDNVSWFTRCCVATDIEDILDLDINTAFAMLVGTTKPVGTSFTLGSHVDPIIDMFDIALGGEGKFIERPFCKAHISPVISPMRYGDDAVEVAMACIKRRVPINAIIAAQSGATAPATLAGMLAQTTAETLAALALVNLLELGYPMIFSNWPLVIDLRTGSFCGGGGEISVMNAAAAQISNSLGLPSGVASSMADAKAVDAQMGSEKAMSAVAAGLAGANMIYESSGMTASLLGVSFEAFVLDNEMLSHVNRMIRGVEVNEETLGFEAIKAVVTGEGHFLGSDHTMAAMQRDYFYPTLADRNDPASWAELGAPDAWSMAKTKAIEILQSHNPEYLSQDADRAIRERFNILM
ncbi:MAG: trimethylamine methyltransferase [Rhodospirillales bacterium]|jgi:trimethylamine---corrinoid protein Co-methyltransferase|nr:trimethylamine methyltransferase [Rhodospirillales bacterium]MBT4038864.1 trimethylamine methyltransferase [Rhodospirillales bacterium]MBT4627561.1 trimethylamine methyltransferase [Rhodospirillales bacterium]MBT5351765.1 trimethylamine methyltransferase [Rhodospirillales bacterium]MBT5521673.1 trimethylamine methyltransferase [Rhodospirillales bacterium]